MRLVAKHAQVGYLQPGARPGCRNCKWGEPYRPEAGCVLISTRWACTKHDLEVTSGGICNDHTLKRHQDESQLAFLARQRDLLQQQLGTSPTWGKQ